MMKPDPERLAILPMLTIARWSHRSIKAGGSAMELASWLAREKFSSKPKCVSRVIGAFMRSWNDALPDDERTALLLPLIPRLVGTAPKKKKKRTGKEARRALMAADWLIRVHLPAWLRLAALDKQADLLASLPEVTDMAMVMPALAAARDAAAIAGVTASVANAATLSEKAWVEASAAVWDATFAALKETASAAGGLAWPPGWLAVQARVWVTAWDAVSAAVSAGSDLSSTRKELQASAAQLVIRMCEA